VLIEWREVRVGMEAADPMRTPRAQNASFNHAPRYAVIAGQLFPVPLAARPLLSISAFRAKFGFRRHLVIGSQGPRFRAAARRLSCRFMAASRVVPLWPMGTEEVLPCPLWTRKNSGESRASQLDLICLSGPTFSFRSAI